jgi:hypothetical protein
MTGNNEPLPFHENAVRVLNQLGQGFHERFQGATELQFKGALLMIIGTALPEGRAELMRAVKENAAKLDMSGDSVVEDAMRHIQEEGRRHSPSGKSQGVSARVAES